MALNKTIARPYAKALFEEALENNLQSQWMDILSILAIVVDVEQTKQAILNPKIPNSELATLLIDAVRQQVQNLNDNLLSPLQNFLALLIENKRLILLPAIADLFREMLNDNAGVVEAELTSAFPLNEQSKQHITSKLAKRFNSKVVLKVNEDQSLLGGVIIRVGNWVLDGSVKEKLSQLAMDCCAGLTVD